MTRQPGCLPTTIPDQSAAGLVQMSDANGDLSWQPMSAAGGGIVEPVAVVTHSASPYPAAVGQYIPVDTTSGAVTVTLPAAPKDAAVIGIKMVIQGGSNAVTYNCSGSDVLNKAGGATSGTLTLLSQGVNLQYFAAPAIWYVQSDDLPLSQLDARYPLLTGATMTGPLVTEVPNIVFDGDSLTNGTGSLPWNNFPNSNDFPSQVVATLDPAGTYYNVGVGGELVATMITNAPTVVDAKLVTGANNIVVFAGGTNDLDSTDNAATTYGRIVTYCQARQAAGWKVVVMTLTPRSDAGVPGDFDTVRLSVNTSIRTNWATFANGLADIGADANMGTSGQETNTQYYNGDNVHHSPVGYAVRASYVLAALSKLGVTGHQQKDRSGLVSDIWIPANAFYTVSGSPTLGTLGQFPLWSVHHGAIDEVQWSGILPREWLTFAVDAVWTNTAAASGNALLVLKYSTFTLSNYGSSPTNLATGGTTATATVTSPVGDRIVNTTMIGSLTANNGDAPRVGWSLGFYRNGTSGGDTMTTDVVSLLGLYVYRVS